MEKYVYPKIRTRVGKFKETHFNTSTSIVNQDYDKECITVKVLLESWVRVKRKDTYYRVPVKDSHSFTSTPGDKDLETMSELISAFHEKCLRTKYLWNLPADNKGCYFEECIYDLSDKELFLLDFTTINYGGK